MFEKIKDYIASGSLKELKLQADSGHDQALTVAVILMKVAYADGKYVPAEQQSIREILKSNLNISNPEIEELLSLSEQIVKEQVNTDGLLKLIREQFNLDQKQFVATLMWQVLIADNSVDRMESLMISEINKSLGLTLEQAVRARTLFEVAKKS